MTTMTVKKKWGLGVCVWMCFVSFFRKTARYVIRDKMYNIEQQFSVPLEWHPPGPGPQPHLDCMLVHTAQSLVTEWGTVVCDPQERSRILMKIPLFKEPGLRLEEYLAQNIHDDGPGGIITRQGRIVFDRWGINDTLSFRFHYS